MYGIFTVIMATGEVSHAPIQEPPTEHSLSNYDIIPEFKRVINPIGRGEIVECQAYKLKNDLAFPTTINQKAVDLFKSHNDNAYPLFGNVYLITRNTSSIQTLIDCFVPR